LNETIIGHILLYLIELWISRSFFENQRVNTKK